MTVNVDGHMTVNVGANHLTIGHMTVNVGDSKCSKCSC